MMIRLWYGECVTYDTFLLHLKPEAKPDLTLTSINIFWKRASFIYVSAEL